MSPPEQDPKTPPLALRALRWTILNVQNESDNSTFESIHGWSTNKTPALHRGQVTMFYVLGRLYKLFGTAVRSV
jgi:hypothetical protein